MKLELRKLTVDADRDIYEMHKEFPNGEEGSLGDISFEDFEKWVIRKDEIARGVNLEDWRVPAEDYYLYADGYLVGVGTLRHWLTDKTRIDGGHIGYAIRPSCQGRGYGKMLLSMLKEKAFERGINEILITVRNYNTPSIKVALANGGIIEKVDEQTHYIWIYKEGREKGAQ